MTEKIGIQKVRKTLAMYKQKLIATYSAVGIGIGKEGSQTEGYNIVIYVESEDKLPTKKIFIEGIPVIFKVSGKFKKLNV